MIMIKSRGNARAFEYCDRILFAVIIRYILLQLVDNTQLATTLLGSFWRIIQDKIQEEDIDRTIWNNRISLSLFFYRQESRLRPAESISLPGPFLIALAISGCTSCTVVLIALDVYNFSCRSIILQKFSFSKVFLLSLRRQLASSLLAISDFPPSFEKFKPVFPFLTFPFFNFESYPPSSLPTTTPVKVLPWR